MDQPSLFEDARIEPPECYDAVAEAIDNAIANGFVKVVDLPIEQLAYEVSCEATLEGEWELEDIERAVRIYHERRNA